MYYTIFAKREENFLAKIDVAPLAGARIEMPCLCHIVGGHDVAPLAGARIEILFERYLRVNFEASLPSRERGLK